MGAWTRASFATFSAPLNETHGESNDRLCVGRHQRLQARSEFYDKLMTELGATRHGLRNLRRMETGEGQAGFRARDAA